MFCRECGCELQENAKFCSKCGNAIELNVIDNISTSKKKFKLSKKQIITISSVLMVLVICIVSLFIFYPTPKKKVIKAFEKIQNTKQFDMIMDTDVYANYRGEPISLKQTAEIKSDITDDSNPLCSVKSSTYVNSNEYIINSYFKDSCAYTDYSSFSDGNKLRTNVDYDEYAERYMSITNDLIIDPKIDIQSAAISKDNNGLISAKINIDGEKFSDALSELMNWWLGEVTFDIENTTDCTLTIDINEDDEISGIQFECVFNIIQDETELNVFYTVFCNYNDIDDDFKIDFPNDLDSYLFDKALISDEFCVTSILGEEVLNANHVDYMAICEIDNTYYIKIVFTENGKNLFSNATTEHVGEYLEIRMGDTVIMRPKVYEPITDGAVTIPMNSYDEAKELFDSWICEK